MARLIRACQSFCRYPELVFLFSSYKEFDSAAKTMMEFPGLCFSHEFFVSNLL